MHHHIIPHSDLDNPQKSDIIDNGDRLLDILKAESFFASYMGTSISRELLLGTISILSQVEV